MKILIKEVADVTFYDLNEAGVPTKPVLFLDTLKVSTIEQTGEQAEARGGKGNAPLIVWDYGKEINVTLEDALFSAKSLAIMFGNGTPSNLAQTTYDTGSTAGLIMKTKQFTYTSKAGAPSQWEDPEGNLRAMINPKYYTASGSTIAEADLSEGVKYFVTYDVATTDAAVVEISATSFPGTYYVTGDTFARNEANGKDEMFQFIIPKAKVQSENTITLEAEGAPSVFNMSLRVLRPADGKMMKLVKYNVAEGTGGTGNTAGAAKVVHNHELADGIAQG